MSVWEYIVNGGIMMYPIFLASIITVAIGIERWRYYNKLKLDVNKFILAMNEDLLKGDYQGVKVLCKEMPSPLTNSVYEGVVHAGQRVNQRELVSGAAQRGAKEIKEYLNYLAVIVTMAPLLGLLGTVVGMIQSFQVFNLASGEPMQITGGIGEALVATATGLIVAVLALTLHTILMQKANRLVADMEYICTNYLAIMEERA